MSILRFMGGGAAHRGAASTRVEDGRRRARVDDVDDRLERAVLRGHEALEEPGRALDHGRDLEGLEGVHGADGVDGHGA